uniref:Small ribosomal subunit protein eS21 n=1 Tax=Oryctolagus cuniculus TaxID=9986 RepID=A0AAG1WR29_RABIT
MEIKSQELFFLPRAPGGSRCGFDMQSNAGEFVDLYVPRKCSASNRIIGAKDHASIPMNVAEVDKVTGRFNGQSKTYAICGWPSPTASSRRTSERTGRGASWQINDKRWKNK